MGKRAKPPLEIEKAQHFLKDWDRLNKSGRYDMTALKQVIFRIAADDGPLPPEYRDHPLTGNLKDFRECHIGGDFLLMYRIHKGTLYLARTGTHSDLFE